VILPDGRQCGIQCVGGRGPEILMYSSLQIGRSYRESADPPYATVSRFYVLWKTFAPHRKQEWNG